MEPPSISPEQQNLLGGSNIVPVPLEAEIFIKNYEEVTTRKRYKRLLNFVDSLGALVVVVVLVVGFWRGSWILGDIYLVNIPNTVIVIGATSVHVVLILWKDRCGNISEKTKRTIFMAIFRRFHTFLFAQACVFTFKGYWGVLDNLYGITFLPDSRVESCEKPLLAWSVTAASFLGLLVLKCFNNSLGPPFAISVDDRDTSFNFPTMFRTKCTFIIQFSLGAHRNFVRFEKFTNDFPKAARLVNGVVSVEEQPLMEMSYLNENEIMTSNSKPPLAKDLRNPYFPNTDVYQLSPRPFISGPKGGEVPYRIQSIEFPQISVYQKIAPKNIEGILAHITAYHKRKESDEGIMDKILYKMPFKFNLLKPDDPKEINMLSLPHNKFIQFDPEPEEYNGLRKKGKPMEIVMSIYTDPKEWRFPTVTSFHKPEVQQFSNKENLRKAVLHMAIYPSEEDPFSSL